MVGQTRDEDHSDAQLENAGEERDITPLPWGQILIVLLIQFAEPITGIVIFPFINQFVRETGVTGGDETRTGYFAGMIVRPRFCNHTHYDFKMSFRNLRSSLQRRRLSYFGGWRLTDSDDVPF